MSINTVKNNDDIWLDVETVAKLKGITERGVRLSLSKKYDYKEEIIKGKKIYKIRLNSLEKEYQLKYENEYSDIYKSICNEIVVLDDSCNKQDKLISETQKKNALAKYDLVKSWLDFRKDFQKRQLVELSSNPNTQFLELYNTGMLHEEIFKILGKVSIGSLYRWKNLLEINSDWRALAGNYKTRYY